MCQRVSVAGGLSATPGTRWRRRRKARRGLAARCPSLSARLIPSLGRVRGPARDLDRRAPPVFLSARGRTRLPAPRAPPAAGGRAGPAAHAHRGGVPGRPGQGPAARAGCLERLRARQSQAREQLAIFFPSRPQKNEGQRVSCRGKKRKALSPWLLLTRTHSRTIPVPSPLRSAKRTACSRAYVAVKSAEDVLALHASLDGAAFVNDRGPSREILETQNGYDPGNTLLRPTSPFRPAAITRLSQCAGVQFRASVEFAPYQRVPRPAGARRQDKLEGTIEADSEYRAFVDKLQAGPAALPSAEAQLEAREAAAAAASAGGGPQQPQVQVSALMAFLKEKHALRPAGAGNRAGGGPARGGLLPSGRLQGQATPGQPPPSSQERARGGPGQAAGKSVVSAAPKKGPAGAAPPPAAAAQPPPQQQQQQQPQHLPQAHTKKGARPGTAPIGASGKKPEVSPPPPPPQQQQQQHGAAGATPRPAPPADANPVAAGPSRTGVLRIAKPPRAAGPPPADSNAGAPAVAAPTAVGAQPRPVAQQPQPQPQPRPASAGGGAGRGAGRGGGGEASAAAASAGSLPSPAIAPPATVIPAPRPLSATGTDAGGAPSGRPKRPDRAVWQPKKRSTGGDNSQGAPEASGT